MNWINQRALYTKVSIGNQESRGLKHFTLLKKTKNKGTKKSQTNSGHYVGNDRVFLYEKHVNHDIQAFLVTNKACI